MYKEFYSLKEKPFSKTPDPRYLYRSRHHAEALARLHFAVEERELAVLTGEIGSGKTLLSRALIDSLDHRHPVVLIVNPMLSPIQLLRIVAKRLGAEKPEHDKIDVIDQINELLYGYDQKEKCPVVILDEAQMIQDRNTFDEIRLLTNFQLDDRNLLSLILIGQPELRKRLLLSPYRSLRQRVGIQFHLSPLSEAETKEYIQFRLGVAGRSTPLFTDDALGRIFQLSHGIPREINNICSCALLEGFGRDAREIDRDIIGDVGRDLGYSLVAAHARRARTARQGHFKTPIQARRKMVKIRTRHRRLRKGRAQKVTRKSRRR